MKIPLWYIGQAGRLRNLVGAVHLVSQQPLRYFRVQHKVKLHVLGTENPPRPISRLKLDAVLMNPIGVACATGEVQSESR